MNRDNKLMLLSGGTTLVGLFGLWVGIPYSGWVLFVGMIGLMNLLW